MADRLVPVTLGLAAGSYLFSGQWDRVASVLQADYSCALKLATPVAMKSGMYSAGKSGVLIKDANTLEKLAAVDTVVFDKTGTLTSGDLLVTGVRTLDAGWEESEVLSLAASIEEHYFHPVAQAVVAAARTCDHCHHFHHGEVEFIVAHGVAAEVGGKRVVIGSRHFLEEDEKISFDSGEKVLNAISTGENTLLYIGYDQKLLGVITLQDQLREESAETLARLHELGIKQCIMLTGDHHAKAEELAAKLGIDDFYAELLPQQKAHIVEKLKAKGRTVAFIGDGINDAPALAAADVGIAMQRGADVARISADAVLLKDDLRVLGDLFAISIQTMTRTRTNYRVTVGANSAILGSASLGLLPPVTTSVLHNGTTVAILLNALRKVTV